MAKLLHFFFLFFLRGVDWRVCCQLRTTYPDAKNILNSQNRLKIRILTDSQCPLEGQKQQLQVTQVQSIRLFNGYG